MSALALTPPWIPEDDLLLKNAVEAGASLEALAKGAVQFSRRFTFQELQDRWHSLLYDPDIAAQASACMGELQGSASNLSSEFNRSDKAAQSKMVHEKRKIGSIRKQYYAMRKRIRSEFFSSVDLAFLDEPNLHNCSGNGGDFHEHVTLHNGPPVGNFTPNHFGLQESDFNILQTMTDVAATNVLGNIGDEFHSEGPDPLAVNHISRVARNDCLHEFPEDVSSFSAQDSLRNVEAESFQRTLAHKRLPLSLEAGKCSNVEGMGSSQPFPGTRPFETDASEAKPLATFDPTSNNLHNACSELGGAPHLSSPNPDGSASFHTMEFSPQLPHLWKTMEDMSAPAMPVDMSLKDKNPVAEDVSALPGNADNERKGSSGPGDLHSVPSLIEQQNGDDFINSAALSDGEFADLSVSLLDFSNEGDLFIDMDLVSSPLEAIGGDAPKVEPKEMIVSNTGLATAGIAYPADSEVPTSQLLSVRGDQRSVSHSRPSTSVLTSKPLELNLGNTNCTLNTEDPEIPCNDDIFLLIHPNTSFAYPATRPTVKNAIDPSLSADVKDAGLGLNFLKKGEDLAQSFVPSQMVGPHMLPAQGPKHALVGCTVKSELPDTSRMAVAPRHANKAIGDSQCKAALTTPNAAVDGKLESIVPKVELAVVDTLGTFGEIPLHAEAGPVEITLPESVVNPLTSDHEEPESDNDVPYFSDIEAMILEMELCSYEEDAYFTTRDMLIDSSSIKAALLGKYIVFGPCSQFEFVLSPVPVSRYQHEDSKRKIRRLEQCAQSSLQRAIASQGALAILYGRRLKHYIRETEVILGRSTEEIDVDIDLGKEGRANKISRRQALIKMETDGSFFLKNLGKTSISVNGKAVATGQSLGLTSSCLIEIRGMSFIFEMNHKCVRRCLDNIAKKSQLTKFEWSPAVET
ncbi:hypothetical protein RHMOL_Rhmol08G0043200 [Rhododendron molle]|uniref:Uncharacterized protein n=1 Tax=Rhododendron molle TaxID=49168 RepID=A0ACC0MJH5_RHOML|nr:hypothetical protein RHMOL_Rhmol08G0043200 [Rhododendron molle]